MAMHVVHVAVKPGFQPTQEVPLILRNLHVRNAKLRETQLKRALCELAFDLLKVYRIRLEAGIWGTVASHWSRVMEGPPVSV
jgi:hypothetical protein